MANQNPVLERIVKEVKTAAEKGEAAASSHGSYVMGTFEPENETQNPVLKRIVEEVKTAADKGEAAASSHSSYVMGTFEPETAN